MWDISLSSGSLKCWGVTSLSLPAASCLLPQKKLRDGRGRSCQLGLVASGTWRWGPGLRGGGRLHAASLISGRRSARAQVRWISTTVFCPQLHVPFCKHFTNQPLRWGQSMSIHWAFVLLFLNLKLPVRSDRQRSQNEGKLLKALKLSWRSSHSHLFSLSKWRSRMHTVFNKSNLFWAWIQPALLSRTPGMPQMLLLLPDTQTIPVTLADTGRATRCQPQLYQDPLHKGHLLAPAISPGWS